MQPPSRPAVTNRLEKDRIPKDGNIQFPSARATRKRFRDRETEKNSIVIRERRWNNGTGRDKMNPDRRKANKIGACPPVTGVHVFDFPFEEDDRSLKVAFEAYGAVKSVKKQTFLSNQNILNGTRLVDFVVSGVLPRFLMVDGYLCRLWYRGQTLVCNLCAVQGHRSANCPNKDKCRKCGKSAHFAWNCTFDGSAGDCRFPPLASSSQSAEDSVSRDSSDSQLLKDNELDLLQSQSILQDLVPVSGDSYEESNQRASKRAGKDKGSSAKRSNSAVDPTFNICLPLFLLILN